MKYLNNKKLTFILVAVFFLVGLFLRITNLAELPSEMHRDEAGIGYNAYSILNTTKDEHGAGPYPIIFESFGDYKLPGMIYMVAASINFFGFSTFAVRLPNVLLASLLIPFSFIFILEIFNKSKERYILGLITSGLVTFSTWSIFLSRTAYEPIAGLTLHILALIFLFKARRTKLFYLLSLLTFIFAFFTYNLPLLLAPMIITSMFIIYKDEFFGKKTKKMSLVFLASFITIFIGTFLILSGLTAGKSETTILSNPELNSAYMKHANQLFIQGVNPVIRRSFTHELFNTPIVFVKNYLSTFDPNYLFFDGGTNPWHSLRFISLGNFSFAYVVLIFITALALLKSRLNGLGKGTQFIIAYLLLSPIPDALTLDAPVTNRLLDFHLALILFVSIGLHWLFVEFKPKQALYKYFSIIFVVMLYLVFFVNFAIKYYYLHTPNLAPEWNVGISSVVNEINNVEAKYDIVYFNHQSVVGHPRLTAPYIHLLFNLDISPQEFQETAVWSDDNLFHRVHEFGKYKIGKVDTSDIGSQNALYVTRLDTHESINRNKNVNHWKIDLPENAPDWIFYEFNQPVSLDLDN